MVAFKFISSENDLERSLLAFLALLQYFSMIFFSVVFRGNAGVGAVPQYADGDIRLEGGTTSLEGRVEVYYQGYWGTVCDDYWDDADASVVCNQLWPGFNGVHFGSAHFGQGDGGILLDDVNCLGTEQSLLDCSHIGLNMHNCYHSEDASVRCYRPAVDGDVRLVGGRHSHMGRVEVYKDRQWGTVCDDYWGLSDANVVCRQLEYNGASSALSRAYFGMGSGPILLDDLHCTGSESRLVDCQGALFYSHNCRHSEDASVVCIPPTDGDVRLINGSSNQQGRLEIYQNGVWMSICNTDWTPSDSTVTCRQLGFSRTEDTVTSYFGGGTGQFWEGHFSCEGDETALGQCEVTETSGCNSGQAVVVSCHVPNDGDIRLQGGAMFNEGRVEVYYQGIWGTVCDDSWDLEDAMVACQQLGFPGAFEALQRAFFGQGQGSIHLDQLACAGSESRIADCSHNGWGVHDCSHYEDASAVCEHNEVGNIRLVDGSHTREGRVEIWMDERGWMTLCDVGWDDDEGEVVCRQLGYDGLVEVTHDSSFGGGSDHIFAMDLGCDGDEDTLVSCSRDEDTSHCTHSQDAGVVCALPDGEARLVDGSESNGRVEIFHDNRWWTVCGHWSDVEARVLCHDLGFTGVALARHSFGPGSGDIAEDIYCPYYAATLRDCTVGSDFQSIGCSHDDDVGVVCDDTKFEIGSVRLVNGNVPYAGRVEMFNGEQWGTICDAAWDIEDAHVVCRQVGYKRAAFAEKGAFFGMNSYRVVSVGYNCLGTELTLHECLLAHGTLLSDCTHHNDSSVICEPEMYYDFSVELVGNATYQSSRVSIFHDGQWKSACSDNWDWRAAQVTCMQAGFAGVSHTVDENAFIDFHPMIFTGHDIVCTGDEYHLSECSSSWSSHICTSNKVASVRCATSYYDILQEGDIRLYNGTSSKDGQVEMFYEGYWRPTCGDDWGWDEATVACREVGYLGAITSYTTMAPDDGTEFLLSGLSCEGDEYRLRDCSVPSIGWELTEDCRHIGGAVCAITQELLHTSGDVKLLPDEDSDRGTVAIFHEGIWGKVCAQDWSWYMANLVCVQLGYFGAIEATANVDDGDEDLDYHIQSITCESYGHLWYCDLDTVWEDEVECDSDDDLAAGVICTYEYQDVPFHGKTRLVEGPDTGHVEVFLTDTWGLVCGDSWSYNEARVVCINQAYRGVLQASSLPMDESLSRDILINDLDCLGSEYFLTDCSSYSDNAQHCQSMAYVECSTESDELSEQGYGLTIQLSGGESAKEGRVEVFIMGRWAPICDDMWTYEDAVVVCRHLGYYDGIVNALFGGYYGYSSVDKVRGYPICGGWEWSLDDCLLQTPYHDDCWNKDVGVNCDAYDAGLTIVIIIVVAVGVLLIIIIVTCICCCCYCKKNTPVPTVTPAGQIPMSETAPLPPVMTDGGPHYETAVIPNLQYTTLPAMDDFKLPPGQAPLPPPVVYVPPP